MSRWSLPRSAAPALALLAAGPSALAQGFDDAWVEFTPNEGLLGILPELVSNLSNETDLAWGDLDRDGWTDLVVARKQPFTAPGKRRNLLFINAGGVLEERTQVYASASDVVGDSGFATATSDRDVVLVDVDQDGWLDVVTATTLGAGEPKHVSHPRVYLNLRDDPPGSGIWQGLEYQAARIPQIFLLDASGSPTTPTWPRFTSVSAGDVTGDGFPDLYFGDHDSAFFLGGGDVNNRLFVNDGNGYFVDSLELRLDATHLNSAFGASSSMGDYNQDGVLDILKQSSLSSPQHVAISYNDPTSEGFFDEYQVVVDHSPYHVSDGDLNNDGRLDLVISSAGADRYLFNLGPDAFGLASFGPSTTYQFVTGGDDGFAGNNTTADLDHDGWLDVLICDVDVDIASYTRRLHIYHNEGQDGLDEGGSPVLREEAGSVANGSWRGVQGMDASSLRGTHDVAPMDVDGDGDLDLMVSRYEGTFGWENQTDPTLCQEDAGGGSGDTLSICGQPLGTGRSATFDYQSAGGVFPKLLVLLVATDAQEGPALGFGVDTLENVLAFETLLSNGSGGKSLPVAGGSGGNFVLEAHVQVASLDLVALSWESSNAVRLRLLE